MTPDAFVRALSAISLDNVFNPYADTCPIHDMANAASTRRKNLRGYLAAALAHGVDTIWMGRDLGYRGGRRTGLALTDEFHLRSLQELFPGTTFARSTTGIAVAERTAAEIWSALKVIPHQPLLWNVFPFHPHEDGKPMTNRRFTAKELATVDELNACLFQWLGIKRIISIGQDAAKYAERFGLEIRIVRHPSYGGTTEFRHGITVLYGLNTTQLARTSSQLSLFSVA